MRAINIPYHTRTQTLLPFSNLSSSHMSSSSQLKKLTQPHGVTLSISNKILIAIKKSVKIAAKTLELLIDSVTYSIFSIRGGFSFSISYSDAIICWDWQVSSPITREQNQPSPSVTLVPETSTGLSVEQSR